MSRRLLFLFTGLAVALAIGALFVFAARGDAPRDQIFPTNYPSGKQTLEVGEEQTRAAAILTYPPPSKNPNFVPPTSPPRTPIVALTQTSAGIGTIVEGGQSTIPPVDYLIENWWYEIANGKYVTVFAGAKRDKPFSSATSQGVVIVWVQPVGQQNVLSSGEYLAPLKAGPLRVVGAVGERLILLSDSGVTFYFDVPTRQFVSSLTEIAPTATITPSPTPTTKPVYP